MQRAAIYARISEDRTGAGLGIQRQLEDCRALAEAHGLTVVQEFTDNDTSAYSGKPRPGYQKMLSAMEAGDVDVVLAWHTDRLHRSNLELEEYITYSEEIPTETVKAGKLDLSTPSGRMTARILGAVARQESEHKAERIQRKAQELAHAGKWTGGSRPFGWQFEDGRPVIVEAEAAIIREAHRHVLAGLSLGSFIESLAERGIKTARGGSWSYATLRQMLMRPRNAGLAEWKGEIVGASEFPAIEERHIWEATCNVLKDPARRRSTTNRVKYLLAGIALCECTRPVKSGQTTDRHGVKHMIYRCSERGPGYVNKRIKYVDALAEHEILSHMAFIAALSPAVEVETARLGELKTSETAYREKLNEAARLFATDVINSEQFAIMNRELKAKLAGVSAELTQLSTAGAKSQLIELSEMPQWSEESDTTKEWRGWSLERKRAWIREHVNIILHRHFRGSARVFDPATVQLSIKGVETPAEAVARWRTLHF
ncbi:recombinase family protein [Paenarthrobacter aurescens]|uniref:recombinase family protein n=1 Tax=Paenarthrobacter aurescens TaxID=43663 RepID=UPI0021C19CE5|nr:recombinase family protein [Paenarthrobacter aurescens]MCT9868743.1 recombinase family protein [Paenarthrobacter aurescens]